MEITPNLDSFSKVYNSGKNYLVYTRLAADLDTTVSLMLKLTEAKKNSFMLESVTGGDSKGRYSIIGMNPDLIWRCEGNNASINRLALDGSEKYNAVKEDPLTSLRSILEETSIDLPEDLPPMAAGLFGYLGYDMIRLVEHLPNINKDILELPDAVMLRPSVIVIIDGVKDELTIVSPAWHSVKHDAKTAHLNALNRVMSALEDLDRPIARNSENHSDRAIGTPVPAVTIAVAVEIFRVDLPSPPVPTISIAPIGADTFRHFERITFAAAAYSSTVSPRVRSAINKPPICASVASPFIIMVNAFSACSRDKGPFAAKEM